MEPLTIQFEMPPPRLFANRVLRVHWAVRHREVRAYRQMCGATINKLFATMPDWGAQYRMAWATVDVVYVFPVHAMNRRRQRGRLPDLDGCLTASKSLIDAIVDAGILIDDGPDYIRGITVRQERPARGDECVMVTVKGERR